MLYHWLKPFLFSLDPETAHNLIIEMAKLAPTMGSLSGIKPDPSLQVKVGNSSWNFPLGLAAGLDKNAQALDFFTAQGFGAIECGTITLRPQEGNPRPRMFRYPSEESLRNAMGFPNEGLAAILPRLRSYRGSTPIGANIGKNKETEARESIEELSLLFEALIHDADYFVINVSSPNTPGLRALQEKSYLTELFTELNSKRQGKDLYLKIAPDLEEAKIIELAHLTSDLGLTGIIATNTTIIPERGNGGLSGRILNERARTVQKLILRENLNNELISVGGITQPQDLFHLWYLGGKAAQIYTAYVFQGPGVLKVFKKELKGFVEKQELTLNQFFALPLDERQYRLKDFF